MTAYFAEANLVHLGIFDFLVDKILFFSLNNWWSHNQPNHRRSTTPMSYWTHNVLDFCIQSKWITSACHYNQLFKQSINVNNIYELVLYKSLLFHKMIFYLNDSIEDHVSCISLTGLIRMFFTSLIPYLYAFKFLGLETSLLSLKARRWWFLSWDSGLQIIKLNVSLFIKLDNSKVTSIDPSAIQSLMKSLVIKVQRCSSFWVFLPLTGIYSFKNNRSSVLLAPVVFRVASISYITK